MNLVHLHVIFANYYQPMLEHTFQRTMWEERDPAPEVEAGKDAGDGVKYQDAPTAEGSGGTKVLWSSAS